MNISFLPIRSERRIGAIEKAGDILSIGDQSFDFGPLPDGHLLPRAAVDCPWLASDVRRVDGDLSLTLFIPVGADMAFASAVPDVVGAPDGAIIPDLRRGVSQ